MNTRMTRLWALIGLLMMAVAGNSYAADGNVGGEVVGAESDFNIQIFAWQGPHLSNPAFSPEAANAMDELYRNRTLTSNVVRVESLLTAPMVSQPKPAFSARTLWPVVRVTAKNGRKLNPLQLRFMQGSSDVLLPDFPNGTLTNFYAVPQNAHYSSRMIGVIWTTGGEWGDRSGHEKKTSGGGITLVDEVIFVGMLGQYYEYENQAEYDNIVNYMADELLSTTFWVEIVQGDQVVARAMRTIRGTGRLPNPVLHALRGNGRLEMWVTEVPGNTIMIQVSPSIGADANWTTIATVGENDRVFRPTTTGTMFFRPMY